jgi:ribosomal protein L34
MEYIILHNTKRAAKPQRVRVQPPGQLALGLEDSNGPATRIAVPEQVGGRYYALTWSPAITGDGWIVERTWGPLYHCRRQRKADFSSDQAAALDLVARHLRRRFRHGYTVRDATAAGRVLVDSTRKKEP